MMRIDVSRLKGKMVEHGYTITSLATQLGVNRNTLAGYFKTPGIVPYSVISDMANILCDTKDEAVSIFFASDLREA